MSTSSFLTNPALYSISWRGLDTLLSELSIPALDLESFILPPFDTHALRPILQERGIYPARDFPHLIKKRLPDIFVTYDWRENILAVRATIWNALQYCLSPLSWQNPGADIDALAIDGVTFWLDWVFIDQSSRNVDEELDNLLPILFRESTLHLVASATALSRAWCCYELAQFNRGLADGRTSDLTSLIPEDLQEYPLWDAVISTDPADKHKIEKRIVELFPGGLHAMEFLMVQAGLAADLRTDTGATAERISQASERWLRRFNSTE